jgi:hypothetical protein
MVILLDPSQDSEEIQRRELTDEDGVRAYLCGEDDYTSPTSEPEELASMIREFP